MREELFFEIAEVEIGRNRNWPVCFVFVRLCVVSVFVVLVGRCVCVFHVRVCGFQV